MDWFIAHNKEGTIWGHGLTATHAMEDARYSYANVGYATVPTTFTAMPASPLLIQEVMACGTDTDWNIIGGIAVSHGELHKAFS